MQPDVGQMLLVSLVWCALLMLSGRPLGLLVAMAAALGGVLLAAYKSLGYVRLRVDRFWHPSVGDTFQTDRALQSFIEGGFFGKGPGEGTIKTVLPDAHTDFIFAVIAEEYGVLACLVIVGLFGLVAGPGVLAPRRSGQYVRSAGGGGSRPARVRCRPSSTWRSTSG